MLFKKKKIADVLREDREDIATNANKVDALIVLAGDNLQMKQDLCELKEQLKYLRPSEDKKVNEYEKKIKNMIDDLKIALNKSDGESTEKAAKLIKNIKVAIAERNVNL